MKELGITKGEYNISKRRRRMNQLRSYGIEIDIGTEYKEAITVWAGDDPQNKTANITAEIITDSLNTAQKCGMLPSELLQQRDELREALEEQKRLYFNLFDEEISCMYCEAKIRRGSAIILCKECAENTEG